MPSPLRILHLEDDAKDAELLQALLEGEGIICDVTRVDSQADFLAALEHGGFDLILADHTLPSFDGFSALKITLDTCPDVPFIFVSGTLGEEVAIEALKIGATDYVLKERLSRIVPAVQRALREAQERTERKRAEEALRRSEAYLAEAQRLTKTGSWAWNVTTREYVYWLPELSRLFGFDPEGGIPSFATVLQRVHPEDRDKAVETIERAIRERTDFEADYRTVLPDGTLKYLHSVAHAVCNAAGELVEIVGTSVDVTERKRAEEERQAHLWFLENMDRVNRALQGTNDLEQMLRDVLDAVLSILACDRAWLVYPCDSGATAWRPTMEQTRPEFPGAFALGIDLPIDAEVAEVFRSARAARGPVRFGPGADSPVPAQLAERFSVQSVLAMAVYPKVDQPYLFGLHQCASPRVWTAEEERLFQEISRRLADALSTLLMFRTLQTSERKLKEAQRIAHVGYWDVDLVTDRITLSDEIYRIAGLPSQEGRVSLTQWTARWQALVHPEDWRRVKRANTEALRGRPRYDVEYRVVRPDGEVRIIHSQGDVMREASGRPHRVFGTMQDITERRRAEEQLRESEGRYRNIFETAGVSMWEEDFSAVKAAIDDLRAQGVQDFRQYLAVHPAFVRHAVTMVKIVDINGATLMLFGARSKDELLVSLHKVFLPETEEVFAGELLALAEGRTAFASETVLQTLTGDKLTVLFTMTFPSPPAKLDSVLVSIMDITEHRRAEEALRRAQAELAHINRVTTLGELTASIAHEVNQPLAAVVTNGNACLRWLASQPPSLDEARECLRRIIRDGTRAGEVIARIRSLVKRAAPAHTLVNLSATAQDVLALITPEARRHGVTVRTELAAGLPPVRGDRVQLQQVLLNLAMNGIEAMQTVTDRPRELVICAQSDGAGMVVVAVHDSGIGPDPPSVGRLFEAFYTTKPDGLGMGLAISRSIIEAHGGRLWAVANGEQGATFQFTVPAAEGMPHD